jgi:hypothetical protein
LQMLRLVATVTATVTAQVATSCAEISTGDVKSAPRLSCVWPSLQVVLSFIKTPRRSHRAWGGGAV